MTILHDHDHRRVARDGAATSAAEPGEDANPASGPVPIAPTRAGRAPTEQRDVWIRWVVGPDAGLGRRLPAGASVFVGRHADAHLRSTQPSIAPFEIRITHRGFGTSGEPLFDVLHLTANAAAQTTTVDTGGARATLVALDDGVALLAESTPSRPGHAVTVDAAMPQSSRVVARTRSTLPTWSPEPTGPRPTPPEPDTPPRGIGGASAATVVTAIGTVVFAVALGQPLMMWFAVVGIAAGSITAVLGRLARRRDRRTAAATYQDALAAHEVAVEAQRSAWLRFARASTWTVDDALAAIGDGPGEPWRHRGWQARAFEVTLGLGTLYAPVVTSTGAAPAVASAERPWRGLPPDPTVAPDTAADATWFGDIRHHTAHHQPIPVDLGPGARLALVGPRSFAVARSLLVQLGCRLGPADWQLAVITDRPDAWTWIHGLPHLDTGGEVRIGDDDLASALLRGGTATLDRHTLVVVDDPTALTRRTSGTRRLIDHLSTPAEPGARAATVALLAIVERLDAVPATCRTVVDITSNGTARVHHGERVPDAVRTTGVSRETARSIMVGLASLVDPEDARSLGGTLPDEVDLLDLQRGDGLDSADAHDLARRWGRHHDLPVRTVLGVAADGTVDVDVDRDGPHALVAGTTGSGKSEVLRSLVIGWAAAAPPDQVTFVLVDFKGGATFADLVVLPHVVGTVTDLDPRSTDRAIRSLRAEVVRREHLLADLGARDLRHARSIGGDPVFPRLVVVIDEFAALATDHPDLLEAFVDLARRGRSLGIHLVLATQRPAGVVSDEVRANTDLRIALRVNDADDARHVVDDPAPAGFPRSRPGRAALRTGGADDLVVFQSARPTLDVEGFADAMHAAMATLAIAAPRRPWCDALPEHLSEDDLERSAAAGTPAAGVLGLVDLPSQQRRAPVVHPMERGNVLLAGSRGVRVGAAAAAVASRSSDAPIVVVDGANGAADAFRCAGTRVGMVPAGDRELFDRLMRTLGRRIDVEADGTHEALVVVIDDLGDLAHTLDEPERAVERTAIERVLRDGHRGGMMVVAGCRTPGELPSAWRSWFPRVWVGHLVDPLDAHLVDLAPAALPDTIPGRFVIDGGDLAQIATSARPGDRSPQLPIGRLDAVVAATELPVAARRGDRISLPIGFAHDDLGPATVELIDGDHLLVVGRSRTGRSTLLSTAAAQWRRSDLGPVVVVARRGAPVEGIQTHRAAVSAIDEIQRLISTTSSGRRILLLVDDAETIDDVDGRLTALADDPDAHCTILAAGRPDALRGAYGHWTTILRRSRTGVVFTGGDEFDGELLGISLSRRSPIAARPGLAHVVDHRGTRLAQLVS